MIKNDFFHTLFSYFKIVINRIIIYTLIRSLIHYIYSLRFTVYNCLEYYKTVYIKLYYYVFNYTKPKYNIKIFNDE